MQVRRPDGSVTCTLAVSLHGLELPGQHLALTLQTDMRAVHQQGIAPQPVVDKSELARESNLCRPRSMSLPCDLFASISGPRELLALRSAPYT